MSKKVKIILGIAFSFVFCFLAIGYAYLTDTLSLTGDVEGDPQDNIFIVDVFETTTNVTSTSYYANRLLQNISLGADETASYYVQIYNSNPKIKGIFNTVLNSGKAGSALNAYVKEHADETKKNIRIAIEEIRTGSTVIDDPFETGENITQNNNIIFYFSLRS